MTAILAQTAQDLQRGNTNVEFVYGLLIFIVVGFLMAFVVLVLGKLIRPTVKHPEKNAPYECGEPAIGSSWVQFDLRFYVVALVFIVFDVEIVLFWPWAVVLKQALWAAVFDMLFFFGIIGVGFLFLWRFGYLDWVRAATGQSHEELYGSAASQAESTATAPPAFGAATSA